MRNSGQFEQFKQLAREKRKLYNIDTALFGLKRLREIYKAEGIEIHYYPLTPKIKAVYMCEDGYHSVAVQRNLPDEPKIFALLHELKHHYCDQDVLQAGHLHCGDFNMKDPIEVSAEIFAAEFIYPIKEFEADVRALNIIKWTATDIVNFKRTCKAKVSYRYICRRLAELNFIAFTDFEKVQFQKLEYDIYGLPYHLRKKAIWKRA